jgi:hypothetical protein
VAYLLHNVIRERDENKDDDYTMAVEEKKRTTPNLSKRNNRASLPAFHWNISKIILIIILPC